MALSKQFMGGVGVAMKDLLLAHVCSAVAGVSITIFGVTLQPFAFLANWANDLVNQANQAIADAAAAQSTADTTVTGITGGTDAAAVAPTVTGMQNNIQSSASAIAALTTTQTSQQTGGASITENFTTTGALSTYSTWVMGGDNLGTGVQLYVRASGDLVIGGSPSVPGIMSALNTQQMATDDHQVSMVMAATGSQQAATTLIIRAAADWSKFVYCNVYGNSGIAYMGYGSYAGSVWTFHDWTSVQVAGSQGKTLALKAIGNTYTFTINGVLALSHTDTAGNAPTGSSYRSVGLAMQVASAPLGGYYFGWDIGSFNAVDLSAPPVVGTGWSIYRAATSSVSMSSGTWSLLGTTFDTQGPLSGVTLTTLGNGTITITKSGWYAVSFRAVWSGVAGNGAYFLAAIQYYPAGGGSSYRIIGGDTDNGSGAYTACCSGLIQLTAGDVIRPTVYQPSNGALVGAPAPGDSTFFTGALVSAA